MQTLWGDLPITTTQAVELAKRANYVIKQDGSIGIIPDTVEEATRLRDLLNLETKKYRASRTTLLKHLVETKTFELIAKRLQQINVAVECYLKQTSVYPELRKQAIDMLTYQSSNNVDDL